MSGFGDPLEPQSSSEPYAFYFQGNNQVFADTILHSQQS